MPEKTDTTTACQKCGGVMKIITVAPAERMMQHTFKCACGEEASFKFPRAQKMPA